MLERYRSSLEATKAVIAQSNTASGESAKWSWLEISHDIRELLRGERVPNPQGKSEGPSNSCVYKTVASTNSSVTEDVLV
jgi:hypothetical protein